MLVRRGNHLAAGVHLDLDGAWPAASLPVRTLDAREWGPRLRFSSPALTIEEFYREQRNHLESFVVYGSGDFHHLSALWVRRTEPQIVVSFDNHPDWDVRPPKWCCGSWVNRALELPHVEQVSVWGCGNFECWWPGQLFGNRRAEHTGRLEVHPWADGQSASHGARRGAILQDNWREKFSVFAKRIAGKAVYVTIDMDGLRAEEAVTNWENGRLTGADVVWALGELRMHAVITAGDLCGAYSPPQYARRAQRFISEMDHPKLERRDQAESTRINLATFELLWPALTERNQHNSRADQQRA